MVTDNFYDSRGWVSAKYNAAGGTPATSAGHHAGHRGEPEGPGAQPGLLHLRRPGPAGAGHARRRTTRSSPPRPPSTTATAPRSSPRRAGSPRPRSPTRWAAPPSWTSTPPRRRSTPPSNTFTGIFSVSGGTYNATKYGYDGHGNQATITDANGDTWTSTYNLLGEATSKYRPGRRHHHVRLRRQRQHRPDHRRRGKTISLHL